MKQVDNKKKPRFLCLHGYARSASILEKEIQVWPESVLQRMDLVFIDGPIRLPDSAGDPQRFDPPYFSWFQYIPNTDSTDYYPNFDRYVAHIEDCMLKLGPFDGVLGFSQGTTMSAALPGMQEQGVALTRVNKIKFAILMSGGKFGGANLVPAPELAKTAFSSPIGIPSIHIYGKNESSYFIENAIPLIDAYVDPFVIHHSGGHEVPKLDEEGLKVMFEFLDNIQPLV